MFDRNTSNIGFTRNIDRDNNFSACSMIGNFPRYGIPTTGVKYITTAGYQNP